MKKIAEHDNWESHWAEYSSSAEENPAQKFRREIIYKILMKEKKTDFSLIDFGSGQGDFLMNLSSFFPDARLTGLELSTKGVEISKRKVPGVEFIQKNLLVEDTGTEYTNSADYGISSEVIEHIDEPVILLKNIKKYLNDNARLILTVPGGMMSQFDRYIGHRKHYSRRELINVLELAGYKIDYVKACGFPFFNLYKIITVIRGRRLIDDIKLNNGKALSGSARIVMKILDWLFKFNLNSVPLGWQVIAVARKNHEF